MSELVRRALALLSDPNPILVKELRATFRTNLFVRFLYISTALIALLVLSIGAGIASSEMPPAEVGQILFNLFLAASLLVIALVAPGHASAALTTEHEQGTWESLELSGMSASRIVMGKLAACYASIALVLVALSPIVGIAFLFGGVSPGQVVIGFLSLLLALAPAVAYGLAISARLRSTRLAIVLSTVTFFPVALLGVGIMSGLGEQARRAWGLGMEGPFFYTEAFVTRLGELDTWILLVGLPIYALGMPTWFLLASAVAGLRPAAEDRARPMKRWAIVMSLSAVPIGVVGVAVQRTEHQASEMALLATSLMAALLIVYGLLFTNEPALPPRAWEVRRASLPAWQRALGVLGAGAAGTMRFSILLSVATAAAMSGGVILARCLVGASPRDLDVAILVLSIGAVNLAVFAATLGALLRLVLAHGLAARILTVSALLAGAVLPYLAVLLVDPDILGHLEHRAPLFVAVSVIHPIVLAIQATEHHAELGHQLQLAVPVGFYGGLSLLFGIMVELRVARARREAAARRKRYEQPEPPA